ncbi:hypothetical protein DPMN_168668 [Dreissena polymorpha]|uniref:Uncharacterized protein n=1 Tax=Dreissena polymorpha TaxID=45954 RepID=A0A9D4F5K1_DREPO|nr:hypothetical protein DPMN_168668 [Dreissena polymorpha]
MFSTVTFVLFVSCCGATLSSWIPYANSYLPEQVNGEYRNSYVPHYDNYGPQQYPSYPGGGWRGNNVGSQGNAVSGYGNVVGSQGNDVSGYGNDVGWIWNSVDGKGNYMGSQWNSVN